jgi:hypothetical protein
VLQLRNSSPFVPMIFATLDHRVVDVGLAELEGARERSGART